MFCIALDDLHHHECLAALAWLTRLQQHTGTFSFQSKDLCSLCRGAHLTAWICPTVSAFSKPCLSHEPFLFSMVVYHEWQKKGPWISHCLVAVCLVVPWWEMQARDSDQQELTAGHPVPAKRWPSLSGPSPTQHDPPAQLLPHQCPASDVPR